MFSNELGSILPSKSLRSAAWLDRPFFEEVCTAVFLLNKEKAPNLDGFSGVSGVLGCDKRGPVESVFRVP